MKIIVNILLSILVFGASFQNSIFVIDYQINKDFYEIHCINKDKPSLACHGKCQMQKESEKSTNPFNLVKYSFEFNILPAAPIDYFIEKHDFVNSQMTKFTYQEGFIPDVFLNIPPQPPQI